MSIENFHLELERAALEAFRASVALHSCEGIYGAALFTSGGYDYVCDTVFTLQGLNIAVDEYLTIRPSRSRSDAVRALRWSPCDSPYHLEHEHYFDRANRLLDEIQSRARTQPDDVSDRIFREIHGAFIAVLKTARASGVFPPDCLLTLLAGDQSNEARIVNSEAVNDRLLCRALEADLDFDSDRLDRLRSNRWPSDGFYEA